MQEVWEDTGRVVVHTTWGEWLTAVLADPGLRPLLGRDWPRYRQQAAAEGRYRFAVSRMVVKYAAAAVLQVDAAGLDLGYKPGGRPFLRGLGAGVDVSLAHTGDLIVVGVSRSGPIGVDAEPADRRPSVELMGAHVCTAAEAAELAALGEEERALRFLQLWTLKEAYTKALGHGMRRRFSAFGFTRDAGGRIVLDSDDPGAAAWSLATHLVQGRYLLSTAHRAAAGASP
ncbi:4'-phosphopantetheinyl transferase superfamily protein [Streptomyces sp. NPDC005485]|uniref:4'-phosphopantetheinyl transferase family protein n=1 Tax=Streptomyces sp. NPDC005485 TaxID=3155591 RepID=UPI0033B62389